MVATKYRNIRATDKLLTDANGNGIPLAIKFEHYHYNKNPRIKDHNAVLRSLGRKYHQIDKIVDIWVIPPQQLSTKYLPLEIGSLYSATDIVRIKRMLPDFLLPKWKKQGKSEQFIKSFFPFYNEKTEDELKRAELIMSLVKKIEGGENPTKSELDELNIKITDLTDLTENEDDSDSDEQDKPDKPDITEDELQGMTNWELLQLCVRQDIADKVDKNMTKEEIIQVISDELIA